MKKKQIYFIYILIAIILISTLTITIITFSKPRIGNIGNNGEIKKVEIDRYPEVNDECTFNISLDEYKKLTKAGCVNGYTRYDINDIKIDEKILKTSIIYSDKDNKKTGLYINDNRVASKVDNISNFKFGIFDNKLFVLDKNDEKGNVIAFNSNGIKIYDLKQYLEKEKVKELSTGDTYVKGKDIDSSGFSFYDGYFEFSSKVDKCQSGSNSKGSHYKVKYKKDKFEKPEFISLINC